MAAAGQPPEAGADLVHAVRRAFPGVTGADNGGLVTVYPAK